MQRKLGTVLFAIAVAGLFAEPSSSQEGQIAQQPAATPDNAASVTVLGSWQADGILGKEVRSKTGENLGRIVDVMVDRSGRARAAIIDFGGFLGVGNRKIAVDWSALSFASDGDKRDIVTLELTREQVKAAPEYKEKRAVIVLGSALPYRQY